MNKKRFRLLIIGILLLFLIVRFVSKNDFSNSIYVMTMNEDTKELEYYEINDKKKSRNIEEFNPSDSKIINVNDCFDFYINHDQTNTLTMDTCTLIDNNNEVIDISKELEAIIKKVSKIKHDILSAKIFDINNDYYIVVELNVNIWSPYRLYYFNKDKNKLKEIYTFDSKDIIGIKLNK